MFTHKLDFDPTEPMRVAVLPFYQTDDNGQIINTDNSPLLIDNVPGVSKQLDDPPPLLVQKLLTEELHRTRFDIIAPGKVQTDLVHLGLTKGITFDYDKILAATPKVLCERLSCDALIYGKVTQWDRSYYGLQTVSTVGIELKMLRAADGKVIYSTQSEDSDSRGLTKGPTGYSSLVLEPLRGLDNEIITDLGRKVITQAIAPLLVENRPEFLESAPPGILASTHDGTNTALDHNHTLSVLMIASGDKNASFSIGNIIEDIPMVEIERGHYVGEYFPLVTDSFENQPIYVSVTDRYGRTTRQKIGIGPVSLH